MGSEVGVNELWQRYQASSQGYGLGYGDMRIRNQIAERYMSLVRYVASRVAAGMPSQVQTGTTIQRDDLESAGMEGLIDAIHRFDPDRGNEFQTYAVTRIRGEIVSYLRKNDVAPRSVRTKSKRLAEAIREVRELLGREPDDVEMAAHLNVSLLEYGRLKLEATARIQVSLDESSHRYEDDDNPPNDRWEAVVETSGNPDDLLERDEIVEMLAGAVDHLSERDKVILYLYYVEEKTLAEIGLILGVTESRVCQLQGRLLSSLGQSLADKAAGLAA